MTTPRDAVDAARYRVLFETTPDGIMFLDDSGLYVDVNDAMCAILALRRDEVIGRHFGDFIPADRLQEALAAFAALQGDGALALEFPLQRPDGTIVNLEWRSRSNFVPGLHFCIARDLTARDAAQQALRDSEERYRAFVANSSEAIWRFELEQPLSTDLEPEAQIDLFYRHGYLAECNDVMANMYGFAKSADVVGTRLGDMLVREDPNNVDYLRAFIASGYRLIGAESREIDRDGNEKAFVNNLVGVVERGQLLRAWGTQRDVSEQRKTERERAALVSRLEFLADVTAVLGSSLDYDQTLASLAAAAVPRFADWCFIDVVTADDQVRRVAMRHSEPDKVALCMEMERSHPTPADVDLGPLHTIRTGTTQAYDVDLSC